MKKPVTIYVQLSKQLSNGVQQNHKVRDLHRRPEKGRQLPYSPDWENSLLPCPKPRRRRRLRSGRRRP